MRTVKIEDFFKEARIRFGDDALKWKFVCPKCKTVQSAADFLNMGLGIDDLSGYLGFSCIGRIDKNKGCDWTLGGLLKIHTVEIEEPNGKLHPYFELAKA